jgi:hypothetical protein
MKKTKIYIENEYVSFTIIHVTIKKKIKNTSVVGENGEKMVIPVEYEVKDKTLYLSYTCRIDGISSISSHINDRNQFVKSKCIVFDRYSGRDYLVNNSVEEVKSAIIKQNKKLGY